VTVLAWVLAAAFLAAFTIAVRVGDSCAARLGPYLAAGMFLAWVWLVYRYDRRLR
jgi:hypothetical protein